MPDQTIPVHHFPDDGRIAIAITPILPVQDTVRNDVHRHDFFEMFFFRQGSGEHMIDLDQHDVLTPCVHVVAPGQVHQLVRSRDMEGDVVMFAPEEIPQNAVEAASLLFNGHGVTPGHALDNAQLAETAALINAMRDEMDKGRNALAAVVQSYLSILLLKCAHWFGTMEDHDPDAETNDPVARFLQLVETDFRETRLLDHYAEALSISAGHLNERVKKRMGSTAGQVIQNRMILEAKRLLLHADLSIKEVAFDLNMNDPAYFTRWFHKATGLSPSAFRTHIREKYK